MVGIDIVYIPSFYKLLSTSYGYYMIKKIFSKEELNLDGFYDFDCFKQKLDLKNATSLAGRFAAKEAIIKALDGDLDLDDLNKIAILHSENKKPIVEFIHSGGKKYDILISISHDCDYAISVAVVI